MKTKSHQKNLLSPSDEFLIINLEQFKGKVFEVKRRFDFRWNLITFQRGKSQST